MIIKNISIFCILISICLTISTTANNVDSELLRLQQKAKNVIIIRDDYGVPHIYGKTDADAIFGMLYAQSEDDFNRIERNYIWAIGRLAEVDGEDALYSDLRARLYMTTAEAKAAYAKAPDWLKALCDAFADGINYYLATHPEVKPKLLTHFEPWMPMFFSEGSIGGDIEQIPLSGIKQFYGNAVASKALKVTENFRPEFTEPKGSNGFAISGKLTKSGNAMLLINPHTSFFFRGEIHVVSEQGLNAYGAVTWGQFFVYQGFNEDTGWMHTSTYADFKDEFIEDISKKDGKLMYRYGDEYRPVKISKVVLKYKNGNQISEREFQMYHTHHGPITHQIEGQWVATKINWDPVNALQQSFIRTKLKGHNEFRKMMDIRTNSSNNTVYADSEGNIAYYHGNFMPRRDPKFDYSMAVDGSNPDTDWQGIHQVDEMVTLLNPENGWLQNCNSTPFTAALEYSPKAADYPSYMAPDPENYRGIHAVKVLKGEKDFTLDKLITTAYDRYLPAFEVLIPGLLNAYDNTEKNVKDKNPDIAEAIKALRHWDYRVADSAQMTLAHFYGVNYRRLGTVPENLKNASFMQVFNYFGKASPEAERLKIFAQTVEMITADFGQWNTPWTEVNRYQRITGDIRQAFNDELPSTAINMASGRWGALASFGARTYPGTKRLYGTSGNSFVAVVEFGKKVRAKSLLAGGQSGDVNSPHFDDQLQLYVEGKFKDVAYYRADVEKRAKRTYQPGDIKKREHH